MNRMNLIVVLVLTVASVGLAWAGSLPTTVDAAGIARHKAAVAKAADPDCQVKWADVKTELDAVDLSTCTNSVWTGAQRVYMANLKDNIQRLLKADAKLAKRLMAEEQHDKEAGVR